MAHITGGQSIPSGWLDIYRATLTEIKPNDTVQKRHPFRLPKMQAGGTGVSEKQTAQRARFLTAVSDFAAVNATQRQRWYENEPVWNSFLWYYNFFMMSSLVGNANYKQGGFGMIKTIQHSKHSVPVTGGYEFTITAVDTTKVVVMVNGSARRVQRVVRGSGSVATGGSTLTHSGGVDVDKCTVTLTGSNWQNNDPSPSPMCEPIVSALATNTITIAWPITVTQAADVGYEITEHNEGSVYPVIVSIASEKITIGWSEEPDAAADVSIDVIEYI